MLIFFFQLQLHIIMGRKNKGICRGCRKPWHYLLDCPTKEQFPVCGKGIGKCMKVERMTENLGKLFFCCSNNCRYFKWLEEHEYCQFEGESSATSKMNLLTGMLQHVAKIIEEKTWISPSNLLSAKENEIMIMGNNKEDLLEIEVFVLLLSLCNSLICNVLVDVEHRHVG